MVEQEQQEFVLPEDIRDDLEAIFIRIAPALRERFEENPEQILRNMLHGIREMLYSRDDASRPLKPAIATAMLERKPERPKRRRIQQSS